MSFAEMPCGQVVSDFAAKTPVPGGGGAAALVGAVGTSLGNMVGSFTKGKKRFADVEEDIIALQTKCDELQKRFLQLMDDDAAMFIPLSKAYAMKAETAQERHEKNAVMEKVTVDACKVPMEIMDACCEAIDALEAFLKIGNPLLVSDVGVGALCCKAGILSASLNVFINTKSMQNMDAAKKIKERTALLLEEYGEKAEHIYCEVLEQLK